MPYWTGFVLFAVVGLPLDLLTWPATALFYPDAKPDLSREFYWFSALGPSVFLGVGGGSVLGGILYPFGIPFMGDANDWNEVRPPSDDEPLPPPPGGSAPPPGSGGVAPVSSGDVAPIGSR